MHINTINNNISYLRSERQSEMKTQFSGIFLFFYLVLLTKNKIKNKI